MESMPKLKRTLTMWPMAMLGLGYLTPAVVFDTFGIALRDTKGHVPTAYALTLFAMIFTAISYGKMVQAYSHAGSSYSYTLKTLGANAGFMVGWLSLLDYLLLPLINVLLAQQYLEVMFPLLPSWIWVLGVSLIVTIINICGIQSTSFMNSIFVYFQLSIVLAFIVLCIKEVNGGMGVGNVISLQPFYNNNFEPRAIIHGATILCFSFLGFDAVSNYAEEAIDPKRDVPKAIILTAVLGGGLFIVASYFTQLAFPTTELFSEIENSTAADISYHVGGRIFQLFFLAASFCGVFASGIVSHASVSRLLYAMGRDKILPSSFFAHLSHRFHTPIYNIIFVGIICLGAFLFTVETAIHFISFGSLVAFSFVNISVIFHYAIKNKFTNTFKELIFNVISPVIGLLFICVLWAHLQPTALILSSGWGILGIIYLFLLKSVIKLDLSNIAKKHVWEDEAL